MVVVIDISIYALHDDGVQMAEGRGLLVKGGTGAEDTKKKEGIPPEVVLLESILCYLGFNINKKRIT
jgi:hypothetical protein